MNSPIHMKYARPLADDKGFTLIEMLITLMILAVGLLALAGLFIGQIRANAAGNELTAANVLAQDFFEKVSEMAASDHALVAGNHPDSTDVTNGFAALPINVMGQTGASNSRFTRTWTVSNMTTPAGALLVVVGISWTDKNGFPHTASYRSIK